MTEPEPTEPPATRSGDPASPAGAPPVRSGMFLLELVPVPVSDVDRAKAFYSQRLGFNVDVDVRPTALNFRDICPFAGDLTGRS